MILFMVLTPKLLHMINTPTSLAFIDDFYYHIDNHEFIYTSLLFVGVVFSIMGISFGYESFINKHYIG